MHRYVPILLLWVALSGAAATVSAFQPADLPAEGAGAVSQPPAEEDLWNFEDEEEEPTFREILRPQLLDISLFAAYLALALTSFFRKSTRLKVITLVASVVYLGIFRSQLISIVNVFGLLTWNLPIVQYNVAWYCFAVFTLVSTVLWGRLYCGRICAYGALTQLMDRVVPARFRWEPPARIERRAGYIKFALLGGVLIYFFTTNDILAYRYVEPFWMFTGQASPGLWFGLGVLLLATVFIRNLYCRFLCPVGAALGLVSKLTVFRIKRWSECRHCRICEKACEWGAIQGPKIVMTECVRCDDCERLYADTKKCPHWLIIQRKSDIMARQMAVPGR